MVETNIFNKEPNPPLVAATLMVDLDEHDLNSMATDPPVIQLEGVRVMTLEQDDPTTHEEGQTCSSIMTGAGVAAGTVGLLLGGPFLAVLLGLGTAYATTQEGATGDTARAVGHVALEAKEKARELDKKHSLVQKGKETAYGAWEKAKELDKKHNFLETCKDFVVWSWTKIEEQNHKHHIVARSIAGMGKFLTFVATHVNKRLQVESATSGPDQQNNTRPPYHAVTH